MKIKALHKGSWRAVTDITKCDDGTVEYQLEGVNGKVYPKDVKDLDLDKGEVTNPDGSITRFPGQEQLKKPLSKGINLMDKWALLKARLNNETAFSNLDIYGVNDEQPGEPGADGNTEDQQHGGDQGAASQEQPGQGQVQSTAAGFPDEQGQSPDGQTEDGQEQADGQLQQPGVGSEEGSGESTDGTEPAGDIQPLEGEQLEEALKELGYSAAEIAYIMHGHSPAIPSEEELKAQQSQQNLEQDQEGHKQTLDQRSEEHDVDLDHKKKMHELELEYAKREKELKLKHLEEELAIRRDKMKAKDTSGGSK